MRNMMLISTLVAVSMLAGSAAAAECYADYKAKQDSPLRLHYGVMQLSGPCNKQSARSELASRLRSQGWTLLNVLTVFGPEGLQQRKANAGNYFLRY
ncbi:hypothetical protein [Heliomarina baculiformis]|uniref:hypothetical protein n=1 Tax=Heliomarina baculiformis TaxID=2872036 RepID=UPI001EE1C149|nr:hypothetical protein [Heliomarina baculiformis]